jgi:hypothetical protein
MEVNGGDKELFLRVSVLVHFILNENKTIKHMGFKELFKSTDPTKNTFQEVQ